MNSSNSREESQTKTQDVLIFGKSFPIKYLDKILQSSKACIDLNTDIMIAALNYN